METFQRRRSKITSLTGDLFQPAFQEGQCFFSLVSSYLVWFPRKSSKKKSLTFAKCLVLFIICLIYIFFKLHLLSAKHSKSLFSIIELNSVEDFVKFGLRYQSLQINISNYLSSYISF